MLRVNATNAAKSRYVMPERRPPALCNTLEGRQLDWDTLYVAEILEFTAFASAPINSNRNSNCVGSEEGLRKLCSAVDNVLAFAALKLEWGTTLSMEWLTCPDDFKELYEGYCTYLIDERMNQPSNVAAQLGSLRHAVEFASKRTWEWGEWHLQDQTRLKALLENLKAQYADRSDRHNKRKRGACEVHEEDEEADELTLGFLRGKVMALESELLEMCAAGTDELHQHHRLAVADCLMLRLECRGGRGVDLQRLYMAYTFEKAKEWSKDIDDGDSLLIGPEPKWQILIPDSKQHFIHQSLDDETPLLDLWLKCFPSLEYGTYIFTPSMHGVRGTKAEISDYFDKSSQFAIYFQKVCETRLEIYGLTPKGVRRLNAENLARIDASKEVMVSHSALLGTGTRNLEETYDCRSAREKGYLASQVQRFQFCPLYNPTVHNKILPALINGRGVELTLSRLIRQETDGVELFAAFTSIGSDGHSVELSADILMRTDRGRDLTNGRLAIDPVIGTQHWRSREASQEAASDSYGEKGLNIAEFAVDAMVHDKPCLQLKDLVYVKKFCTIGEVVQPPSGSKIRVRLATERDDIQGCSSKQTFYRFLHNAEMIDLSLDGVLFPIDLTFIATFGHFILRKSKGMATV